MTTPLPLAAAAASVLIKGQPFEVSPAKLPQLLRVTQLLDEGDLLNVALGLYAVGTSAEGISPKLMLSNIARHGSAFVEAFATLLRMERAALDELELDDLLRLFIAAVKVNIDFFTQCLMAILESLPPITLTPPSGEGVSVDEAAEPNQADAAKA